MSFFIAKLNEDPAISEYFERVQENGSQAMLYNKAKIVRKQKDVYWLNVVGVSLPPFYLLGFLFLAFFLVWDWSGWLVLSGFFGMCFIPFWRGFHIFAFKKGLRKAGYKGSIIIVPLERGVEEVGFL
jgi:hypothetical protein